MNKILPAILISSIIQNVSATEIPRFIDRPSLQDTNLMCMDDRCYSLLVGQFLTQDRKQQNYSFYNYGKANPIKYSDPTGDFSIGSIIEDVLGVIVGAVIAFATGGAALPEELIGASAVTTEETGDAIVTTSEAVVNSAEGVLKEGLSTGTTAAENAGKSVTQEFITPDGVQDFKMAEFGDKMQLNNIDEDEGIGMEDGDNNTEGNFNENTNEKTTPEGNEFNKAPPESPKETPSESNVDGDKSETQNNNEENPKENPDDKKVLTFKQKAIKIITGPVKDFATLGVFIGAPEAIQSFKGHASPPPNIPPKPQ